MKNVFIISIFSFILFACNNGSNDNVLNDTSAEETVQPAVDTASGMNVVNESDERFLKEGAASILLEVETGQLALQKTNNQALKKLSNQVVEERLAIMEELKKLSSLKNVTLPNISENQHRELEDLQKLNAAEFDKEYLSFIIELFEEDTRKFEKAANNANSPEIKVFASKSLPTLRKHLDAARSL